MPDRLAISDRVGSVRLHRGKMPGAHRIVHDAGEDPALVVPSMTLDAWVERHAVDLAEVTFVKLNTRDRRCTSSPALPACLAEPQIAWQVEVAPWLLRLAGSSPEALDAPAGPLHAFHGPECCSGWSQAATRRRTRRALAYLELDEEAHTDVLVYRASASS